MNDNLTILIPTRDREEYLIRLLFYLSHINCPFKILVADGGKGSLNTTLKENKDKFERLRLDYSKYPYDETLTEFHNKMRDIVCKIDTPLTMMMDDDELPFMDGMLRSIQFLQRNPLYVSSRGAVRSVFLSKGCSGNIKFGNNIYRHYPSVTGANSYDRLFNYAKMPHSAWHNVVWSNNLKAAITIMTTANPTNMRFSTQMIDFIFAAMGNEGRDTYPYLLHQENVVEVEGKSSHFVPQAEWVESDHWVDNFSKMMDVMASVLCYMDDTQLDKAKQKFVSAYLEKLPSLKGVVTARIRDCFQKYGAGVNREAAKQYIGIMNSFKVKEKEESHLFPFEPSYDKEIKIMEKFLEGIQIIKEEKE